MIAARFRVRIPPVFLRLRAYCVADGNSLFHSVLDAGWCAGIAILLLQCSTAWLAESEMRDRVQYALVGGWAALYIATGIIQQLYAPPWYRRISHTITTIKLVITAYAALALTCYFIAPLWQWQLWWLWMAASGIALSCNINGRRIYPIRVYATAWLLLCVFSLCFTLMYQNQSITLPTHAPDRWYALPFIASLLFIASVLGTKTPRGERSYPMLRSILFHLLAVCALLPLAFRTAGFRDGTTIHHWRAFLESAFSVRAGGWLMWDVPSQYGFLQTLVLAFLPTETNWQSFYLLNGSLQLITGYAIFAVLFASYRSIPGYVFSLSLASACLALTLPCTMTPLVYPSTGVIRFFWTYTMVGYVFFFCHYAYRRHGQRPLTRLFLLGHCLWMLGVLWSVDSALYITVVWLPTLVLIACGEACTLRHIAGRLLPALAMAALVSLSISITYLLHHGALPDIALLTGYTIAYQTFMAYPITALTLLPCWLCIFYLLVILAKSATTQAVTNRQNFFHIAALYSAGFTIWACASYYIPFSENLHITGTMPLLVFVTALALWLLPSIALPDMAKLAFEKTAFCLYAVILLGTLSHFNAGLYMRYDFTSPIESDITRFLPTPTEELQALLDEANLPPQASMQIIHGDPTLESFYWRTPTIKPWLLPNSIVAFRWPLPADMYQTVADRRAQTADRTGWVLEADDFPIESLPWLHAAILKNYTQTGYVTKGIWHLRKFEKIAAPDKVP